MYQVVYAQGARKALKRLRRSGSFSEATLVELLTFFISGAPLPAHFRDHALRGEMVPARECHLGFDLLVVYKRNEELKVITISDVGTHAEIFGK